MPSCIQFVLFDMDGLLLDTERVYTDVTQEIVAKWGKTYDWSLKSKMIGLREKEAGELLVKTLELPITAEEYLLLRNEGHKAKFPFCKPLPGVLKFVSHLKSHGIPMAVATSSHKSAFCLKSSRNAELFDMFEGKIICGDSPSVAHGKPAPDIFLAAAKELLGHDLKDPSNCLVFEDAPSGVKAGLAAGMQVCWIPDRNLTMDEELKAKAHCIIYSMEDFDPVQFGLPPYSSSSGGD